LKDNRIFFLPIIPYSKEKKEKNEIQSASARSKAGYSSGKVIVFFK